MPSSVGDINIYKVSIGNSYNVSKICVGEKVVYTAGNVVTYHVDTGVAYQEEVDEGASCLTPKTFTPSKNGWTFVGWRQDTSAGENVLKNLTMGDEPITLYAVFRHAVTVTYYDGSTTASSTSKYKYYNNGNVANPSFALSLSIKSGWQARGWSTSTAGNGGITYASGEYFTIDSSSTLYGMYQQTIKVTYYNNSTTAATKSGTRYYNSNGNVVNPSFTLSQAARSGWTARGWSTSTDGNGAISYNNGAAFTRDSNITLYGCYQQTITVTYYNNSTTASTTTGTRYYNSAGNTVNPSFTLTQASASGWTARGWSTSNAGNASITYNNATAFTRDSNVTLYGCYQQTITVTYYNNSTTASTTTGTRYYNSCGNTVNPSFTLTQAASSGWTARGWSTSNKGDASITYASGTAFTRDSNITLYGLYSQTITLTTVANGTTTKNNGTRYWAPAGYINPTFTVSNPSKTGATFQGWSSSAGSTAISNSSISNLSLSASTTRYAVFKYSDATATSANGTYTYKDLGDIDKTVTLYTLDTANYESHTVTASVTVLDSSNNTIGKCTCSVYVDGTEVRRKESYGEGDPFEEVGGYVGSNGARFTLTHAGNLTIRAVVPGFSYVAGGAEIKIESLVLNGKTTVG